MNRNRWILAILLAALCTTAALIHRRASAETPQYRFAEVKRGDVTAAPCRQRER